MKILMTGIFMLLSTMLFAQKTEDESIFTKKFTYQTLSKYQKILFDDFIEEQMPKDSGLKLDENTSSRGIIRLASALLYRNKNGDVEKAVQIIKWIFTLQNLDEKSKDFAIWRGSGKPTNSYDQNWREFIGTDLIIIYDKYRHTLPVEVQKELEICLIRTVKGAIMRNVNPDYNNISIMSSFMMEYVGTEFNIPEYKNAGLEKARAIYNNFLKYNTLCEYNSPTYYGVDFVGLALWRELSFSLEMKAMSKVLEKELWLDVATFYNANLQNICGPYLRAYGIDIKKTHAIISTWIAVAIDNPQIATIPGKDGTHHEREFIVPIVEMGISMPTKALAQFKNFDKPRFITRTTSNYYEGDRLKKVTANIQKDWMMGGLWGNRKISHILKTGTMHWKAENGDIGWLFVPGEGKTNVKVDETKMQIFLADTLAKTFQVFVYENNISSKNFKEDRWKLPNMTLKIKTDLKNTTVEVLSQEMINSEGVGTKDFPYITNVIFEVPVNWDILKPLIEITPKR
jgi:hypothetical protein